MRTLIGLAAVCAVAGWKAGDPIRNAAPLERPPGLTDDQFKYMKAEYDVGLYLGASDVHGVGVFVGRSFDEGEVVMRYNYEGVDLNWVPTRVLQESLPVALWKNIIMRWWDERQQLLMPTGGECYLPWRDTQWVHYLNHDKERVNIYYTEGQYVALKHIPMGSEVLLDYRDYNPEHYRSHIQPHERTAKAKTASTAAPDTAPAPFTFMEQVLLGMAALQSVVIVWLVLERAGKEGAAGTVEGAEREKEKKKRKVK